MDGLGKYIYTQIFIEISTNTHEDFVRKIHDSANIKENTFKNNKWKLI